MSGAFLDRLGERIAQTGSVLCVGLDPDPAALPAGFPPTVGGIERFAALVVEASAPFAAAFKPNLAFFEAFGSAGLGALERIRALVPEAIPVVADAKRGDIASTAARQAVAVADVLGADAVTVSPYLGFDAVAPFVERGVFAYVLCRTSNPSAGELQDLGVEADAGGVAGRLERRHVRLHERVARMVSAWDAGRGSLGLVVGATAGAEMAAIRHAASALPFLVPGIGAQGGALAATLRHGPARAGAAATLPGGGLLVNVSRGIAAAGLDGNGDPHDRVAEAASTWSARLRVLHSKPAAPGGGGV